MRGWLLVARATTGLTLCYSMEANAVLTIRVSPWRPLYDGDSGDATPRPGGFNFSINLENFQTTAAAVNSAGEWHGTGLSDEAWPTSCTIVAWISSGADVQAIQNLPPGSRVVLEQTPRRYCVGELGNVTRDGAKLTIPILNITERYNWALFYAGHDAKLDFTLSNPNLRNPTDTFSLNRYDPNLNTNGEWNYALKAGASGAKTWDQLATFKAYITSADTKSELGRLGSDGRIVYITIRDTEKNTANWADVVVSTPITIEPDGNTVTFTVTGVHNAVGELPPQDTGAYEMQVSYFRLDLAGWAGFNRVASLKGWREDDTLLEDNRDFTMLVNGSKNWEKTRWPTTAELFLRISGIQGTEDAVLVRNLFRIRKDNFIGIRNSADSFAEYKVVSHDEQMDSDYRYGLELVEGQLRGGPNFNITRSPEMWFLLAEEVPPLWITIFVWKYHTATQPPLPGIVGYNFNEPDIELSSAGATTEPGWRLSPSAAKKALSNDEKVHTHNFVGSHHCLFQQTRWRCGFE